MLTIALIYFTGGVIIGYGVAQLLTDYKKDEVVNNTENTVEFKYEGKCERCGNSNGQKVILSRYNILCNRCEDKILGLD